MTRDQIIEAGAKAIAAALGYDYALLRERERKDADRPSRQDCLDAAAAMLDAITTEMGNKLMGREPTCVINRKMAGFPQLWLAAWDAAPWVPGDEK